MGPEAQGGRVLLHTLQHLWEGEESKPRKCVTLSQAVPWPGLQLHCSEE